MSTDLVKFQVRESDFADDLEGIQVRFQRVKMPSGDNNFFQLPNENGEFDAIKEIKGRIIDNHPFNIFFPKPIGSGEPPECYSRDGKQGTVHGDCKTCPHNQLGAEPKCSNKRALFLMTEGKEYPIELDLPPTSLGSWGWFVSNLLSVKLNTKMVEVIVKLEPDTNKAGIKFAKCVFSIAKHLTEAEYTSMIALSNQYRNNTRGYVGEVEAEEEIIEVKEIVEKRPSRPDFSLAQMILNKTGYGSKNPNRHLLNKIITSVEESSKWTEIETGKFIDYCFSVVPEGEGYTEVEYAKLKEIFDKVTELDEILQ